MIFGFLLVYLDVLVLSFYSRLSVISAFCLQLIIYTQTGKSIITMHKRQAFCTYNRTLSRFERTPSHSRSLGCFSLCWHQCPYSTFLYLLSVCSCLLSSPSGLTISQQRWSHRTLLPSWRLLTAAGSLWATMAGQAPAWGLDRPVDNKGGLWIGGPVGSRCRGNKAGQGQIKSAEGNTAQG